MSPLCPSEYLIRAHHSRRRAEGALARSSPPAAPRALCGCLAWDLTDAAHVPLGRDGNFNSAPPSAHVSFLTSGPWGRKKKKKSKHARCVFCFLLACVLHLLVMLVELGQSQAEMTAQ